MSAPVPPVPYDHYLTYAEVRDLLDGFAAARPDLIRLETIGSSHEGREIPLVVVTRFATGLDSEKPALWVDGNIHATEVSPTTACLTLIRKLLTEDGVDPDVTRVLDTRVFYVCPRVNPDGAEVFLSDRPKYLRSSTRPYPHDEEPIEGLRREDLNGDGKVLTMRILDPQGPWKTHPDEPRLLVRRDPTETDGVYYRLLPEGMLDGWDGVSIGMQKPKEGLDLNRNFPAHWRQEHEQRGAGPYPTSEPEVRAVVEFITSHPNITGGVTFHTYSGVLLRPYGTQSDEAFPAEDLWTYEKIGAKGTEITGYPAISVFHDFKYHPKEVITGVFDDWLYDHLGVFGWTTELWSPQMRAGCEVKKPIEWYREHPVEDDLRLFAWNDEKLGGLGFVDWQPFEHPQLGPVEIGGWDTMYMMRNPPPPFLEAEVKPHADWLIWHLLISPRLELHSAEAAPIGQGAYRVRLVVHNTGWLPTYVTKKALERKITRGVVAEIAVDEGVELVHGLSRQEGAQLEGRAYEVCSAFGGAFNPTEERAKFEWVVHAPNGGAVHLTARHDRAGVVRASVTLG
jgi:murein tripeptide amidase MpaA